jgi:feruloyl-CoA synthase
LRVACLAACDPLVQDAVVCAPDRDYVALLIFAAQEADPAQIREALRTWNEQGSTRIARALILREPPSIDAGEITDKGYLNQRAILMRRSALVERLYQNPPPPEVLVV